MPVAEQLSADRSTYVHIPNKLAAPLNDNDLCKEWVVEWLQNSGYEKPAMQVNSCGTKVVSLACSNGHQKWVRTSCHKEYCPRCGSKGSLAHKQRYLRAMDRLIWAPVLGYMVFTLPKEVSDAMPPKEQISKIEKEAVRVVQANFETPGCMVRAHFMGDENEHLHIHINVLFPITNKDGTGTVPQETLNTIREQWTIFVNQTFNLDLKHTNVFYKFKTSPTKMRHVIKYVTRSIVVAEKFLSLTKEAKHWYLSFAGWHNTRWYGQLANCKYKEYLESKGFEVNANQEGEIALAKQCPVCKERYKYQGIIDVDEIPYGQFRRLDENVWVCLETFVAIKDKALLCP